MTRRSNDSGLSIDDLSQADRDYLDLLNAEDLEREAVSDQVSQTYRDYAAMRLRELRKSQAKSSYTWRIPFLCAALVIGAMAVYPPWIGTVSLRGRPVQRSAGYHPIFSPPMRQNASVIKTVFGDLEGSSDKVRWQIDVQRLLRQWILVTLVAAVLAVALNLRR